MPTPHSIQPCSSTAPVLEATIIANLRALDDGEDAFLAELARVFRSESPSRIAGIRRCSATHASSRLVGMVHALKGSARTLGLVRLADVCQQIESAATEGQFPPPAMLQRLDAEYTAATRALAALGLRQDR